MKLLRLRKSNNEENDEDNSNKVKTKVLNQI